MRKRILSLVMVLVMLLSLLPTVVFAWETETDCEHCGKFIADDWICDGGDHCSEDADGGCYDEHHCPDCKECVDELCGSCELCENCATHCPDCGACIDDVDLCEGCGYCDNCAVSNFVHCPDCNVCLYDGEPLCTGCGRCADCGGECELGLENCGICFDCHSERCEKCDRCFLDDDSDLCPGCGICRECVDEWCDDCVACVDCAIEAGDHCPECKKCFKDVEECLVCNRCLDCGGGMCSDHHTEMCMECHLDMGKACRQCNKCYGDESEDTAACSECGRCADCVGEDICENCHMCTECAEDQGKHCKNCGRCEEDVDVLCANCGQCGDCGGECSHKCADMCLECHIDSENACPDCSKCYILGEGVGHEGCTECYRCDECTLGICENCGMCLECAVDQELHCPTCYECHENVEICGECKEVCENCADEWCANCHMCLECAKDQKEHCPDCGACGDDADLCPECGKCESCSDEWCSDCGKCLECHDSKDMCTECGNICIANGSPCGGHCEDCFDELKCPECERCSVCEELTLCEDCGMCVECAIDEGLHCPECKNEYDLNVIKCDTCNMCTDCAFYNHSIRHCDNDCGACEKAGDELCPRCGWCRDCQGDDWCDTCHKCLSTCHKEDEVCGQCGDCFAATGKTACPECGNCTDCCEANSKAAGCDHGVCIKSENWESHWSAEHAGTEHTHVYGWYYTKTEHHKRCLVTGCGEFSAWEPHRYGDWTVVIEPTETEDGMRARVCVDCGRCDEESINKLSHKHSMTYTAVKEPTCTEGGNIAYYTCSGCGKYYSDAQGLNELPAGTKVKLPALGHDYQWVIDKAATTTEKGLKHQECTRCHDKKDGVEIPVISAEHKHTFKDQVVAPTCTEQGYTLHTCTVCGHSEKDTYVAALGHKDSNNDRKCDRCGATLSSGTNTPAGGSGSSGSGSTGKDVKSGNTGDAGIALYAGLALLSVSGGVWTFSRKRKKNDK